MVWVVGVRVERSGWRWWGLGGEVRVVVSGWCGPGGGGWWVVGSGWWVVVSGWWGEVRVPLFAEFATGQNICYISTVKNLKNLMSFLMKYNDMIGCLPPKNTDLVCGLS